jgi:hypothetical protein
MASHDWAFLLDMASACELAYWPLEKLLDHWLVKQGSTIRSKPIPSGDLITHAQVTDLLCKCDSIPRRTKEKSLDAVMVSIQMSGRLVLSFRGTKTLENVLSDATTDLSAINANVATGLFVHSGFQKHHRTLMRSVIDEITKYVHNGGKEVIFTGHSLGASACIMSAFSCAVDPVMSTFMQDLSVRCVTFGCPRIGTRDFADWSENLVPGTMRVVNGGDIVTSFPRKMFHVGELIEIAGRKTPCLSCHKLENYMIGIRLKLPGTRLPQMGDDTCRQIQGNRMPLKVDVRPQIAIRDQPFKWLAAKVGGWL